MPAPQPTRCCTLPETGVIAAGGPQAAEFLQGQLSNDLRRIRADRAQLAALATPQGRVFAILRVLTHREGYLLLVPRALVGSVLARLARYVLRAKVELADRSAEFAVFGVQGADLPDAWLRELARARVSPVAVPGDDGRSLLVLPAAAAAQLSQALAESPGCSTPEHWRLAEIRAGLPEVYPQTQERFVPQMLNLDLVGGLSFDKGCYTGQEVIARTQHLGRIKRRMLRFGARREPAPGDGVFVGGQRIGRVVVAAPSPDGASELLATVALDAPGDELRLGDAGADGLTRLSLPYAIPGLPAT